jgi:Domain of unknown function (DUF397)
VIDEISWVKSSHSGGSGGNCVEVAALPDGGRAVRDSKDVAGPVLVFPDRAWDAFARAVRDGSLGLRP